MTRITQAVRFGNRSQGREIRPRQRRHGDAHQDSGDEPGATEAGTRPPTGQRDTRPDPTCASLAGVTTLAPAPA